MAQTMTLDSISTYDQNSAIVFVDGCLILKFLYCFDSNSLWTTFIILYINGGGDRLVDSKGANGWQWWW